MTLTDTHTHLYAGEFDSDRDALIGEAKAAGITRFFLPNIDSASVDALLQLEKSYPENCFAMMGLHPCSVKENWEEEMARVETLFEQRSFAAVGEIGIDLYWDKTFVKEQEEVFRRQLRLARKKSLPVVIHSRESFEEIYSILLSEDFSPTSDSPFGGQGVSRTTEINAPSGGRGAGAGIFHCFTGTLDQAHRAIALGFYLGIGGVVTFKNSGLDKEVSKLDLQHLVLETDAPYLAPVPYRGKRNEPAYLLKVAEKIAALKNTSVEEVARITTENSRIIFGK